MYRLIRFIFALVIIAAAVLGTFMLLVHATHDETGPRVDVALSKYVEEWKWDVSQANIEYQPAFNRLKSIEVTDTQESYAGVTVTSARKIKINLKHLSSGEYRVRATLYHELGHFVFGLDHGSCAIMQEECQSEEQLEENWKEYVNEYLQLCINNSFNAKY